MIIKALLFTSFSFSIIFHNIFADESLNIIEVDRKSRQNYFFNPIQNEKEQRSDSLKEESYNNTKLTPPIDISQSAISNKNNKSKYFINVSLIENDGTKKEIYQNSLFAYQAFNDKFYELALLYYKDALKKAADKNTSSVILSNIASSYYFIKDYNISVDYYLKSLEKDARNQKSWYNIFISLDFLDHRSNLNALLKLDKLSPKNAIIIGRIGFIYLKIGEIENAIKYLQASSEMPYNKNKIIDQYNLAIAYDLIKDKKSALEMYQKVLQVLDKDKSIPGMDIEKIRLRVQSLSKSEN